MKKLFLILMLLLSFPAVAEQYDTGVTLQKGQFVVISVDGKDKLVYNAVLDGEKLIVMTTSEMKDHIVVARVYNSDIQVINTITVK